MTDDNTENHKAAGPAGGVQAVVSLLKKDNAADSLLEAACGALQNMTVDTENQKEAGPAGGVQAVVSLLEEG